MNKVSVIPVVGIDVGTSRIVMARRDGDGFSYESQLNAFVTLPWSRMAEGALTREGAPYTVEGNEILVFGNEAPRFANLLNSETRRPMVEGVLNPGEQQSLNVVRRIVESMTAKVGEKPRVCFSVPAAPLGGQEGQTYHEATLRQTFADLAVDSRPVNEGLAVVYSELEDSNYTGIGVSFGGGLCNVAVSYLAMATMSFSITKAGDFIDASTASVTGELANRVRISKEASFHFNGHFTDQVQQVLTVYYDDMINSVLAAMKDAFTTSKKMPKLARAVPMVLSGGTACPKGFKERFEKLLREAELPVEISEVRMARDPLTTTARGALVAGLAEM